MEQKMLLRHIADLLHANAQQWLMTTALQMRETRVAHFFHIITRSASLFLYVINIENMNYIHKIFFSISVK